MKSPGHAILLLHLLNFLPAGTTKVFRLEAENLPTSHAKHYRSGASGQMAVHVVDVKDQLIFSVCLYRDLRADLTLRYSNDGGADVVAVLVDNVMSGVITTRSEYSGGHGWNSFREDSILNISLTRGMRHLSLGFLSLDQYGVEIDFVDVRVYDDFINDLTFRCSLVLGAAPQFGNRIPRREIGYVEQHSYVTSCAEEDNVHLAVYHRSLTTFTITATSPLYKTFHDYKEPNVDNCDNLGFIYWRLQDVDESDVGHVITCSACDNENPTNATITGEALNDVIYTSKFTITFDLKGFKTGFIDADIHSVLRGAFTPTASGTAHVKIMYVRRDGTVLTVEELHSDVSITKKWDLPEMTWSEDYPNVLYIFIDDATTIDVLELHRGYTRPDQGTVVFTNDAIILQGFKVDFWWRRPAGEQLSLRVNNNTYDDFSYLALYVLVPWGGQTNYQQVFTIYQDGNVRLLPLPYGSASPGQWQPFGSSVIVGRSDPADLRPAAAIKTINFHPETLIMVLTYYDRSSCSLVLTYSPTETTLTVTDLNLASATPELPFATFRSMFVKFGETDSDSIQSDVEGPLHVMGSWTRLYGSEFFLFRAVESYHLTHSPDIRLTIGGA